jgi:hypothetical protein
LYPNGYFLPNTVFLTHKYSIYPISLLNVKGDIYKGLILRKIRGEKSWKTYEKIGEVYFFLHKGTNGY